jgi:virginiamycin B lyase
VLSTTGTAGVARAITTAATTPTTVWFTEASNAGITRIGRIQFPALAEFNVPTTGELTDITEGSDGGIWFTDTGANRIARLERDGSALLGFPLPTAAAFPYGVALGPDGNVWFTMRDANKLGFITPAGAITEICIPTSASGPTSIAPGPDGNMWFTETASGKIGRVTMPVMAPEPEVEAAVAEAPEASDSGCNVSSRRPTSAAFFAWALVLGGLARARRRVSSGRREN